MKVLIDTNIFLRVRDDSDPRHEECVAAVDMLKASDDDPCVGMQVLAEYWVVSTRPRDVNGMGLSTESTALSASHIYSGFTFLPETSDTASQWLQIMTEHRVLGRQAHDARLVALMLSHSVTHILTLNTADFARYPEITALTPAEILSK